MSLTARRLSELIKERLRSEGVDWQRSFADGFVLGDPDVEVRGVGVTFKPTLDVLRRAAELGFNVVVSHEAAFWEAFDPPQVMPADPVRRAKIAFAREHGIAVWRLHDHLHRMRPEPVFTGLLDRLGWSSYFASSNFAAERRLHHVEIPEIRLDDLAAYVQDRLSTRNVSVVGDPAMIVRSVGFGVHTLATVLPALRASDVAIVGETAEYDTYEYVRDAVTLGSPKGLIRIAHERLEVWGVAAFADWLRPSVPDRPVAWLPTADPFTVP